MIYSIILFVVVGYDKEHKMKIYDLNNPSAEPERFQAAEPVRFASYHQNDNLILSTFFEKPNIRYSRCMQAFTGDTTALSYVPYISAHWSVHAWPLVTEILLLLPSILFLVAALLNVCSFLAWLAFCLRFAQRALHSFIFAFVPRLPEAILPVCSVWDVRTRQIVKTLETSKSVLSLEIVNSDLFMTADNTFVKLWDANTFEVLKSFTLPYQVESASYSPQKQRFAAGGEDMWVHLYDFASGEEVDTNKGTCFCWLCFTKSYAQCTC